MWELCTFEQLAALLGLTKTPISNYPALALIKTGIEAAIENYCGRGFESKERTESFYITGPTSMIKLIGLPISSVDSATVTIDETEGSLDYIITEYGLKASETLENALVEVTYTGGLSALPDDLNRAALYQTTFEFLQKDQLGAESVTTEGGTVSRPELGLLKEVKRLLNKYIHPLKITG